MIVEGASDTGMRMCCRYAPSVEEPVFHFHKQVHADLIG